MTSKEKVLSVYPDAFEAISGRIWRDNCGGQAPILLGLDWDDAASKLPSAPSPAGETAKMTLGEVLELLCQADEACPVCGRMKCFCWVAAPIAPAAVSETEKVYRDYIGALRLAYPENPLALNVAKEVHDILRAKPSAEGDGWIAAHRVAKALTNLIVACDRAQDWSGGTRVGNAIDEAEAILAELPAPPSGQGEVR